MATPDGRYHFAINGEVYNFAELRRTYQLDSPTLKSKTDSEIVLRLLARRGPQEALGMLDGMFALAMWDQETKRLHLARDSFGTKPLFMLEHMGVLWFASEIKPLLLVPGFNPRPSLEALHHYLSFDYVPGRQTAFEGIEELRPGHHLMLDTRTNAIESTTFSAPSPGTDPTLDMQTCISETRRLLEAAVQRQLVSDVPIGVMLSGGVDSSALVAMVAQVRGDANFQTYGLGFDQPSFDETEDALRVASHFGTNHHAIRVTASDVQDQLHTAIAHIDEPYADGSAIPTMMLAKQASQDVTVLLSGEGGDELFAGYDTHAAAVARRRYRHLPGFIRRGVVRPVVERLRVSHEKLSFEFKAKRFVHGAELELAQSHHAWRVVLTEDAKRSVLQDPDRFDHFSPSAQLFADALEDCTTPDEIAQLLHIDRSYHLPDDLMVKNDRMTMAHGLEARVPFCDLQLASFLASVPSKYLMQGLSTKVLLRRAMHGILPAKTCKKKKIGLEMPYSTWLREDLHDMARDMLSPSKLQATGLFEPAGVTALFDAHCAMRVDHGRALWGLLNFMVWHELYIEANSWSQHVIPARPPR